ncbi:MAG: helix-turn-helix transcriptional regulator [Clostridiales bacterium]|nr:helix-turn-helix transcriptional regulator [Clostridiales bacterium]
MKDGHDGTDYQLEVEGLIHSLIEIRRSKDLTQSELAYISDFKQPVLGRLESMKSIPKIDTFLRLLYPMGYTLKITPIHERQETKKSELQSRAADMIEKLSDEKIVDLIAYINDHLSEKTESQKAYEGLSRYFGVIHDETDDSRALEESLREKYESIG